MWETIQTWAVPLAVHLYIALMCISVLFLEEREKGKWLTIGQFLRGFFWEIGFFRFLMKYGPQ